MNINGQHYRTIWLKEGDASCVQIIDQRGLPHQFIIEDLFSVADAARAIREMHVRGAPLIGATAAYGFYLACLEASNKASTDQWLKESAQLLLASRPTAVDLSWAVALQQATISQADSLEEKTKLALKGAQNICDNSAEHCRQIGNFGLSLIQKINKNKDGKPINILTHCNAGWLACVDYGTAIAPIYAAHEAGIPLHVWVDETRPRNQGARITAWELLQHGIPHTVIVDNLGGHLMQHGMVDMVIVGSDRTTRTGDVANKIGTYLKALAAKDNQIPFYVALPSSSIDWDLRNGIEEIPIEERDAAEVKYIQGLSQKNLNKVLLTPEKSPALNFGFDVTPAHLVTALITEKGICEASEEHILQLFPEKTNA